MFFFIISDSLEKSSPAMQFNCLEEITKQIFLDNSIFLEQFNDNLLTILEKIILKMSDSTFSMSDQSQELLIILCDLVSQESDLYKMKE